MFEATNASEVCLPCEWQCWDNIILSISHSLMLVCASGTVSASRPGRSNGQHSCRKQVRMLLAVKRLLAQLAVPICCLRALPIMFAVFHCRLSRSIYNSILYTRGLPYMPRLSKLSAKKRYAQVRTSPFRPPRIHPFAPLNCHRRLMKLWSLAMAEA